jgi:hypothetical protein
MRVRLAESVLGEGYGALWAIPGHGDGGGLGGRSGRRGSLQPSCDAHVHIAQHPSRAKFLRLLRYREIERDNKCLFQENALNSRCIARGNKSVDIGEMLVYDLRYAYGVGGRS